MPLEYNKVDVDSPEVVTLADKLGCACAEVAGMINADRYRKAYNKRKQERDKVLRRLVKEHPELLAQVEGGQ